MSKKYLARVSIQAIEVTPPPRTTSSNYTADLSSKKQVKTVDLLEFKLESEKPLENVKERIKAMVDLTEDES